MNLQDKINLINETYNRVKSRCPETLTGLDLDDILICPDCNAEISDLNCGICGGFVAYDMPDQVD